MSTQTKELRWGLGTRSESQDARSRLLEAAQRCYARLGIDKTSMADIAAEAKITRRTVYRYFSSQKDIINAVVQVQSERFWAGLHASLVHIDDFGDYMVEALLYTLKFAPRTPTHGFLFNEDILAIVHEAYIRNGERLVDLAESWRPIYDRLKPPGAPEVDLLMVAEWFNRLAISFLAAPSSFYRSEDELRQLFRSMLLPALR